MFFAKDPSGIKICARCGKYDKLTIDHFIPQSCRMTVNESGNYVAICQACNRKKANSIVLPSWYTFLTQEQQSKLTRYMRYARSFVISHTDDEEIIEFVRSL